MGWLTKQEAALLYASLPEGPLFGMSPEQHELAKDLTKQGLMVHYFEGTIETYEASSTGRALLLLQRLLDRAEYEERR